MDRSRVENVVISHLSELSAVLGLQTWEISIAFDPAMTSDGPGLIRGDCTRLVDYNSAHITLNPEAFADEDAVLTTLRHELFHIVLAPIDLYTSAVERLETDEMTARVMERIRDHAIERAVAGLERMWTGLIGHSDGPSRHPGGELRRRGRGTAPG